jgi:hypothetical protein
MSPETSRTPSDTATSAMAIAVMNSRTNPEINA